ncbi:Protein disulfide-isomerase [Colletotrichum orbiculare MAFF 240422]|uniref:Protein disulfide-isomerase n=1 Tax=Colletotrichum orbiculare (strain 104-T / ATCC 96160 / CBS 514.97 / LARS 414 / MAFF 240422) TaxID=1213857 RepID=A0A484G038_COLOR|nr:Protein disulfide-isomerase [Colletotrichum orbiculare MAFF 240422]
MRNFRAISLNLVLRLLVGAACQDGDQTPLRAGSEVSAGEEDLKLVAYVKPSDEKSLSLEQEWTAARSSTTFPMEFINAFSESQRCPTFMPEEYPVIRLLRGEEVVVDYTGPRTSQEILRFINRASNSRQVPISLTKEEVDAFKDADEFTCIAHLDPSETALATTFSTVAEKYWTDFSFATTSSTAHSSVRGWPMIYILSPSPSTLSSLRSELHDFAKKHYASLTVVAADPTYFPDLPASLGLDLQDGYPAGAVHQLSTGKIYPYPNDRGFTPRELQSWGLDVWQGRVRPFTPPGQEPIQEKENVKIVTSHNLKVKKIPGLKIKIGGRQVRDEL